MASSAQIQLWHAEKVATQVEVGAAPNGIHFAAWGETRIPEGDLQRLIWQAAEILAQFEDLPGGPLPALAGAARRTMLRTPVL